MQNPDNLTQTQVTQPIEWAELPLCDSALSNEEALLLQEKIMSLLRFLGSPGDWGCETKLGRLTVALTGLRAAMDAAAYTRCEPCRETGLVHCSDPLNCGGPWTESKA